MQNKLRYGWMLSLKEICLRRVTVILRSQTYALASIENCYSYVENEIISDMRELGLPPLLAEQMTCLAIPVKFEIIEWKRFHESYLDIKSMDMHILQKLCWTNSGAVNFRKSAEKIIRYEMLDINKCYKLACFYCLDDYIPILWEKLPEESKRYFYKEEGPLSDSNTSLEFVWPYILKGEETKLNNMLERSVEYPLKFHQYMFENSAYEGNKAATEYFFQKLTDAEKKDSLFLIVQMVVIRRTSIEVLQLFYTSRLHRRSDTFSYLLSLLSLELQMEIFKEHPFKVLKIFLDWPWRDISLEIADLVWPFLTAAEYASALRSISMLIKSGFNLTKLFRELFLHGSLDFRKHFVDQVGNSCLFDFSKVKDLETIRIIFRAVDSEDKRKLVFSRKAFQLFYDSILIGNCVIVELCLLEANFSAEDKEELKEAFYKFFAEFESKRIVEKRANIKFWNLLESLSTKIDEREHSGFQTETDGKDSSGSQAETETDGKDISGFLKDTESDVKDTSGFLAETEIDGKDPSGTLTYTEKDDKDLSGSLTETDEKYPSGSLTKTETDEKDLSEFHTESETDEKDPSGFLAGTETDGKDSSVSLAETKIEGKDPSGSLKETKTDEKDPSGSQIESETDEKDIERREHIWEKFLHIVDEGNAKTSC